MKKDKIEQLLAVKKGAESSYPFGPDALVFKVMGKMFALVSQKEETPKVTLKCIPADGEVLVQQFPSIMPGYYMNKKHWITLELDGELADEMVSELADNSYDLIVSKLTQANQKKLEAL